MSSSLFRIGGLLLALVLVGCGGGGDGPDTAPRVSIDTTDITASSAPVDQGPTRYVTLTIANLPKSGAYVGQNHSSNGLANVSFYQTSATTALLQLDFRPGASLVEGSYRDTIDVVVCLDDTCKAAMAGSPMRVRTTYTVSATSSATIDSTRVDVTALAGSTTAPTGSVLITTAGPSPASALRVVAAADTTTGLASLQAVPVSDTQVRIDATFAPPTSRVAGAYTDTATLKVCYDTACTRQVTGSPFTLTTHYTVDGSVTPEPGVTPLTVSSRAALAHDVIDAEYSKALNAVVMVSSSPSNALYVYSMASGTEKRLALNKLPVAVSISPDGAFAAVGHDALVTHVDLASVGGSSPVTKLLNLSSDVFDLALDGHGTVHVFPATDQWVSVHSIAVATNTETLQYGPRAGSHARLHPSGNNIYAANNGLSPDDIENYQIVGSTVTRLGDSPYHGDYPMCGNLWFDEDGAKIYTACGRSFRAATARDQDMVYAGTMALSVSPFYGYRILSLSAQTSTREIALIEQPWYECQDYAQMPNACVSHLSLYDSDFLNLTARYSIPPVAVGASSHSQRGLFVFHKNGGGKVLISRLVGIADTNAAYLLSVLP